MKQNNAIARKTPKKKHDSAHLVGAIVRKQSNVLISIIRSVFHSTFDCCNIFYATLKLSQFSHRKVTYGQKVCSILFLFTQCKQSIYILDGNNQEYCSDLCRVCTDLYWFHLHLSQLIG